ncbi:hypothetical protein KY284_012459 [Solanum tuberosum]|nr:hypothetical protein KY284_012459 [Solanum tuberosum]
MSSSYIDSANSEQLCYIPCNFCNIVLVVSVPCSNLLDIVTVRCGHCTNLWSVNMAAAFHSNSWQNHHQYLHHQVGNYTNSPHDQYKIDCGSSSITNNSTHTHEERIVNRPPEKRQRGPSAYNQFIKEEIQRIKANNPDIAHREAFSTAAKNWAHFPHIQFGLRLETDNQAKLGASEFNKSQLQIDQIPPLLNFPATSPPEFSISVMKKVKRKLGKYEVGRTIGEGTFAKVKFARNTETGENVAIKVLAKSTILKHRMVEQIKREISIMKIVRHPCIVRLHEVLASQTKIYIIQEFVTGGELFDKIVHLGRLSEDEARRYFQQLIDAIAHCHSKGVYHRDLKPENLLLDFQENLKISDFGLSALPQQGVELLYTTCGTPNYVAPEVLSNRGYDGAAADVWSCGIILYVLMAGYLPFEETDLPTLYTKIKAAEFSCPFWFSPGATSLIQKIIDPNPQTRIKIDGIKRDPWFRKNYRAVRAKADEVVNLDDVRAVFDDIEDAFVSEKSEDSESGPLVMNAFEMITLSQGLNLSALFDRRQDYVKRQTRFVSRQPAKVIIETIEAAAESLGLKVHTRDYKTRIEGVTANRAGQFAVVLEVFQVAPSLFMVDVRKAAGDTLEYHKFYKTFCTKIDDVIWKPKEGMSNAVLLRTMTR